MAEETHDCARFSVLYEALKERIINTSLMISKYNQVTQEKERFRRQLQDTQQFVDTLHADCERYKQEACAALTQIDPLKQRCNRLQAEVNLLSQQKEELELSVNSSQAALKQCEALLEKRKHQELPEATAKPKEGKRQVLFLKKKLEETRAQLKQAKRSLREAGLEIKQMRTRCKSAVERTESLGKRLKERGVLGRREDRFVKRIVACLEAGAQAASSTEDESEAERDGRHLEELLTANAYEEAEICDVEEILAQMRLPALIEPLSPDPVPKGTKPESPGSPVKPSEQVSSSMKGPELEHPKPFPSVAEPQSPEQSKPASLAARPASPSRPELQSPLKPQLAAPPKAVPVEKQPELLGSLESVTHATQPPGSAAQPKPVPLEVQTELGASPEPVPTEAQPEAAPQPGLPDSLEPLARAEQTHSLIPPKPVPLEVQTELGASPEPVPTEAQPEAAPQPGLPESLEPLARAEQSHSLIPPKPVPLEVQTELGASPDPVPTEAQPEAAPQPGSPESLEPLARAEQLHSLIPPKPVPLEVQTELGASPEPVLTETQPEALTRPGLVDSPEPVSCAREQDLLVPVEPVPPEKQTQLEAFSEPVLITTKLGAPVQLLTIPFVTQQGLPELPGPSFVAAQIKLPASPGLPTPPEPHLCAAKTELREESSVVPRAVQPEFETLTSPPPEPVLRAVKAELPVSSSVVPRAVQPEFETLTSPPPETVLRAVKAELPVSSSVVPRAVQPESPPETPETTSLATQQAAPKAGSAVTPPALRDPSLFATQTESPAPPKAVVPLVVTEAELQATSSVDYSPHVSTSPQPTSTSPASQLLLSVQPPEPSRTPSSSSTVLPSKESVLPELSWEEPSPKQSRGSSQEPPPESPPKQSSPEPQSQGPPPDAALGMAAEAAGPSRRQLTNAQVVSGPESLELMLCVRIPKEQLDQLGKFVIGLDVAEENVKVSCEGEAVPTVSLQTARPALGRALVERPASLGALEKEEARRSSEQHWAGVPGSGEGPRMAQRGGACRQNEGPLHKGGPPAEKRALPGPEEEVPPQPLPATRVSPRRKQRIARERKDDRGEPEEALAATGTSPRRKQQGDGGDGQPGAVELLPGKRQWLAREKQSTEARLPSEQPVGLLGPKLPQVVGPSGGAQQPLLAKMRLASVGEQQETRPAQQQQALPPPSEGKQCVEKALPSARQQPGKELAQLGNRQGRPQVVVGPWCGPSWGATKMRLARERPPVGEQAPNQQQEAEGKQQQLARDQSVSVEKPLLSARQQAGTELAQGQQAAEQSLGNRQLLPVPLLAGARQWITGGQSCSEQQQCEKVPLRKEAAPPLPESAREGQQTTVEPPLPSGSGLPGKESLLGEESPQQLGPQRRLPRRLSWLTPDRKEAEAAPMGPKEEEVLPPLRRKQRVARVKQCAQEQQQQQQQTRDTGLACRKGEEEEEEPAPVLAGPKMKLRSASRKPWTGHSDEELKREMQLLDVRVVLPRCTQVPGSLPATPQGQQAGTGRQSQPPEGPLPRKRPRLDKQQLRELFAESGDSEEEEQEEEGEEEEEGARRRQVLEALSQDCAAVTQKAAGNLVVPQVVRKALARLSGLSAREAVQREVLASLVRGVARDRLVMGGLAWLERTQANPQAAFCRGEQAPPLVTRLESLLVHALALYPGGQRAMLSAVRARLWSPQRPPTLHAQASYVRLMCTLCRELHEPALARVLTWDLLGSSQAPFLVAAAVGAWPRMLTAFPKGPVRKTLSYVLLCSPVHSLNSTLVSQARQVLRQLGPLAPVEDSEQQLAEELLRPLVNPHRCTAMLADACLMHRLALEELCRRSPGGLLPWLLCQRVAPQLAALAGQPQAVCILRLLGYLSRLYFGDIATLEPLLQQLEVVLPGSEPALRQLAVSALLRLPKIDSTRWQAVLLQWRQEKQQGRQPATQQGPSGLRTSPRNAAQAMRRVAQ